MKILATIIIGTILASCGPTNTDFDPFDKEYKFHQTFRPADYDTIIGECGYWNLTKRDDGTYYQFFLEENEIVAKGFDFTFEEIQISNLDSDSINRLFESIEHKSVDVNEIKARLKQFHIKHVTFLPDSTLFDRLELIDERDSIYYAAILPYLEKDKILRRVSYFNDKGD